jgi:hypothetical protein
MLMQFLDVDAVVSASLSTEALKGTWDSASLKAKTLKRDYAEENMGQCESKERDFRD